MAQWTMDTVTVLDNSLGGGLQMLILLFFVLDYCTVQCQMSFRARINNIKAQKLAVLPTQSHNAV